MENKKKIIGMLVAVEIEAVLQRYGERLEDVSESGYSIKRLEADDYIMYILKSGAGALDRTVERRQEKGVDPKTIARNGSYSSHAPNGLR